MALPWSQAGPFADLLGAGWALGFALAGIRIGAMPAPVSVWRALQHWVFSADCRRGFKHSLQCRSLPPRPKLR